jgi:UDP-N-acetylglucosamine 2-epimerase
MIRNQPITPNADDEEYLLLTLHRGENVDDVSTLRHMKDCLNSIREYKVIFPVHPRTKNKLTSNRIELSENVTLIDPVGYLDFLGLLKGCKLVLTDSGGVQEEAAVLGKPCITLRQTTERWETLLTGGNRLYPLVGNKENLNTLVDNMLQARVQAHPYGENVTERTVNTVKQIMYEEQPLRVIEN